MRYSHDGIQRNHLNHVLENTHKGKAHNMLKMKVTDNKAAHTITF